MIFLLQACAKSLVCIMSFNPPSTPEEGILALLQLLQMMKWGLESLSESFMVTWATLKTMNQQSQGLKPVISASQARVHSLIWGVIYSVKQHFHWESYWI